MTTKDRVRISFDLERVDGWPPVVAETMWCEPLGLWRYRIDNIPFFVRRIAYDDVVLATGRGMALRRFRRLHRYAGHCSIRLIPADAADVVAIRTELATMGCDTEFDADHRLIAIDVPPTADVGAAKRAILAGAGSRWDVEEGSISSNWIATT